MIDIDMKNAELTELEKLSKSTFYKMKMVKILQLMCW